jgi:hypothetical protein
MEFNDCITVTSEHVVASDNEPQSLITVKWDNDINTVIRQTYKRGWQWEEFFAVADQTSRLVQSVSHRVDILADFLNSGPLPVGPAIMNVRLALRSLPENWGSLVIVTNNGFIRMMLTMFNSYLASSLGNKTYVVSTFVEAYDLIASMQIQLNS